jgi:hypothetical protein
VLQYASFCTLIGTWEYLGILRNTWEYYWEVNLLGILWEYSGNTWEVPGNTLGILNPGNWLSDWEYLGILRNTQYSQEPWEVSGKS